MTRNDKEDFVPKTSSIRPVISIKFGLVTDRQTDTQRQHIYRASICPETP